MAEDLARQKIHTHTCMHLINTGLVGGRAHQKRRQAWIQYQNTAPKWAKWDTDGFGYLSSVKGMPPCLLQVEDL